jgi:hypothetical protein
MAGQSGNEARLTFSARVNSLLVLLKSASNQFVPVVPGTTRSSPSHPAFLTANMSRFEK